MTYWVESSDEQLYEGEDEDPYPALREALGGPFRGMSADDLEAVLTDAGLSPSDLEFSFGNALSQAGKFVQSAAPAVLPVAGTVVGSMVGGPVGGALGASLGGAAAGAIKGQSRPQLAGAHLKPNARAFKLQPPLQPARPRSTPPGDVPPGMRHSAPPKPRGSRAAAQLLDVINRPELLVALLSMALSVPNRQVPVGSTPVPAGAFANLLSSLASEAAAEHHALTVPGDAGIPLYLLEPSGEMAIDPTDPDERAARLLDLLDQVPPPSAGWQESTWDEDGEVWQEEDEVWDELELEGM